MTVIGPLRDVPVERLGYVLPTLCAADDPAADLGFGVGRWLHSPRCDHCLPARRSASSLRSFEEIIAAEIGPHVDDPGQRAGPGEFVASQLLGVVMARYILELEPFASLPVERIAETIGPNL